MSGKKILITCLMLALFSSFLIYQDVQAASYGTTSVYFSIPTDTSFSVSILGQSAYNITSDQSGTPNSTASWIAFNATTLTEDDVEAQAKPGDDSNKQTWMTKPIFIFANTGTVNINISLLWSGAGQGGPDGCVTVRANSTCFASGSCSGAQEYLEKMIQITTGSKQIIGNISQGMKANVSLRANFTSCNLASFDTTADLLEQSAQG